MTEPMPRISCTKRVWFEPHNWKSFYTAEINYHVFGRADTDVSKVLAPSLSESSSIIHALITLKTNALKPYETLGHIWSTTQRHIPEDLNPPQYRSENIKSYNNCTFIV
jgi:hypothetical protein